MDIDKILLWIILILFVIMVAWYVLGSSPTLDIIMFLFTILFIFLSFESRKDMKKHIKDTKFIKEKLNRLDDIYNILKERLK